MHRSRQTVIISTLLGEDFFVTSPHADDMYEMLTSNLQGLRERSKHAIVLPGMIGEPGKANMLCMQLYCL